MTDLYEAVVKKQPEFWPEPEYLSSAGFHKFIWLFEDGTTHEQVAHVVLENFDDEVKTAIIDKYADQILNVAA